MTITKIITPEFRAEAVRLVEKEHQKPAHVAKELGVSPTAVREWVTKSRANTPAADDVTTLKKENEQLRQELRRAQQEKEILKKAAAFFAKELR